MPENIRGKSLNYSLVLSLLFFTCLCTLFLVPVSAHAHKVYLFAWAEGDRIFTESYFGGDKKVKDGLITVFDQSGKEILQGRTNENGEFPFLIPSKQEMRIVLESSMGHGAEYIFRSEEIYDDVSGTEKVKENKEETKPQTLSGSSMDMENLKTILGDLLDSRLKPLSRRLADLEKERGPGITEIIGGIGYIFGIMGLVLYFKSSKKNRL